MTVSTTYEILFQDHDLLAVNKPAGTITIRDGYDPLRLNLHQALSTEYGRLWVVHRLDADTSGVLLFARNPEMHRYLSDQFEHHTIQKTYHLLTLGHFEWQEKQVDFPIKVDGDRRHRSVIDPQNGKPAVTDFSLIELFDDEFALLSASPASGYTHQIRAHCAALGLWLIADPLYFPRVYPPPADAKHLSRRELFNSIAKLPITRTALHAFSIRFDHPVTQKLMMISAPYPEDIKAAISRLRE